MNNQEAFDQAVSFLFKQGCPAQDDHGECYYRGPNGTKCAVGALIPNELYISNMEHKSVQGIKDYPGMAELLDGIDLDMLRDLQTVHDTSGSTMEMWPEAFAKVADTYELSTDCLEKVIAEVSSD